ncbi:arginase family protein, partial [Aneurinibacillus thermoaerophilus]
MNSNISIIGVPMDLGADRRGVDMGPSAIRYAGVVERLEKIGYTVHDEGDIVVRRPKQNTTAGTNLKYLDEIARVNRELCDAVSGEMKKGHFPLVIGGDHSIA